MAEYIEREVLKERFRKRVEWLAKDEHDVYSKGLLHGCETDAELVDEIPAADVAPVVHGEWTFKWDAEKDPKRLFVRIVCSECNLHTGQKSNYCPNCGAKMQGGKDNV